MMSHMGDRRLFPETKSIPDVQKLAKHRTLQEVSNQHIHTLSGISYIWNCLVIKVQPGPCACQKRSTLLPLKQLILSTRSEFHEMVWAINRQRIACETHHMKNFTSEA